MASALTLAPVFGDRRGPRLAMIGLALILSLGVSAARPELRLPADPDGIQIAGAAMGEVGLGLILGFTVRLALLPLEVLAAILTTESGLGLPSSVDPVQGVPSSIFDTLLRSFGWLAFLILDGPAHLIRLLARSLDLVPLGVGGATVANADAWGVIPLLISRAFQAALELGLPLLGASFMATVSIAVLARALPKLNLFTDVLPIRLATALTALLAFLPLSARAFRVTLELSLGPAANTLLGR